MSIFLLLNLFAFTLGNNQVEITQDDYCAQIKFYNSRGAIVNSFVVNDIYGYKIAEHGKYLYVLNKDGISIYNEQGRLCKRINDRGMVAVSSKDEYLVCVTDNIIKIYTDAKLIFNIKVKSLAIRQVVISSDNKYLGVMARDNFSLVSLDEKQIVWNRDFSEPLIFCKIANIGTQINADTKDKENRKNQRKSASNTMDDKIILATENRSQLNGKIYILSLIGEIEQELDFNYQQNDEQIQDVEVLPNGIKAKTHLREWEIGKQQEFETTDYTDFHRCHSEQSEKSKPKNPSNPWLLQESIPWPLGPTDSLHPIGNNWFEYQNYGSSSYFHPGVDILSPEIPNVPVYAVKSGFVKSWLSTGSSIYWRFCIADSSLSYTDSCNGYLYAHIDSARYHVNIGDTVAVGDLVGYLVYWPVDPRTYFQTQRSLSQNIQDSQRNLKNRCGDDSIHFHHCHFAKVRDRGSTWTTADWAFIFSPQILMRPNQDSIPPVFENAVTNQKFAFARNSASTYLSPNSLNGAVDIIAKIYDKVNVSTGDTIWDKLIPLRIEYEIIGQDSSVPRKLAFSFSHRIPTNSSLVSVVYKQDNTCSSQGDYENRDYYFIVTNTDGDSIIESSDAQMSWQTTNFPNGNYWVKVYAYDVQNISVCSMQVTVNNAGGIAENENIARTIPAKTKEINGFYNSLGQKVNDQRLKPGVYFYQKNNEIHKLLIIKPNTYFY